MFRCTRPLDSRVSRQSGYQAVFLRGNTHHAAFTRLYVSFTPRLISRSENGFLASNLDIFYKSRIIDQWCEESSHFLRESLYFYSTYGSHCQVLVRFAEFLSYSSF